MNETIYARLTQAAKEKKFISYGDLSAAISLSTTDAEGLNALNKMLEAIAENELANGRPLLVAIIINENTNAPGAGLLFFSARPAHTLSIARGVDPADSRWVLNVVLN